MTYYGKPEVWESQREQLTKRGVKALKALEEALYGRDWLVGESMTIADIALYAYTHVAHEGGFDLADYPAIREWLGRITAQPGHVPIEA
jgi:glutathione S-transferase